MSVYRVGIVGDGISPETAYRPDIPPGTPWGAVHIDAERYGECLIATDADLAIQRVDTDEELAAYLAMLAPDEVDEVEARVRAQWGTPAS